MKNLKLFSVFIMLTSMSIAFNVYAQNLNSLSVDIDGAIANKGQAICSLFNSRESYLKTPYETKIVGVDSNGRAFCQFIRLDNGVYAVSVIYDENLNGKLDTGLLRMPKELIGMSNNAKGRFGPPKFKKSKFELSGSMSIKINLSKVKND